MSELPQGWQQVKLGDLAEYLNGAAFKPEDWGDEGMPIIRIQNLNDPDRPMNRTTKPVNERLRVQNGDILVSWSATLDAFIWDRDEAWLNQHIFRVLPREHLVDKGFLFFLLKKEIAALIETEHLHGSTMKHINRGPFLSHQVPLPPLDEQRRIVARLDALLARSKRARAELARVPGLAERQRQAVLNQMSVDTHGDRWPRVQLRTLLLEGPTNGYSPPAGENSNGTLSLKLSATTKGYFDLSERTIKRLEEILPPSSKYWLRPGDILIQRANSLEYVGATAIYEGPEQTYIYPDLMMRIRVASPVVARWIWRYLNSAEARQYFMNNATGTAGNMPKINGSTVRGISVPLPPLDCLEQRLILVESAFARIDRAAGEAERAAALLDRLDQATLGRAFRGEL